MTVSRLQYAQCHSGAVQGRFQLEYQTGGPRIFVWCFGLRSILSHIQDWREQLLWPTCQDTGVEIGECWLTTALSLLSLVLHSTFDWEAWIVVVQSLGHVWLLWPHNCNTPGSPVLHYLREFAQTHVHWLGGAIQPSHPLSSLSPPALNLSQHQGLFQWVSSLHQVAKVLELQLYHQFFQWMFRVDFL